MVAVHDAGSLHRSKLPVVLQPMLNIYILRLMSSDMYLGLLNRHAKLVFSGQRFD